MKDKQLISQQAREAGSLDLSRIRDYVAKATAGPWRWQKFGTEYCLTGQYGNRPIILSASRHRGLVVRDQQTGTLIKFEPSHPDAVMLENAPTDLPLLLDRVEQLEKELQAAKLDVELLREQRDAFMKKSDHYREAYLNMRQFAEGCGLDTTARNPL